MCLYPDSYNCNAFDADSMCIYLISVKFGGKVGRDPRNRLLVLVHSCIQVLVQYGIFALYVLNANNNMLVLREADGNVWKSETN